MLMPVLLFYQYAQRLMVALLFYLCVRCLFLHCYSIYVTLRLAYACTVVLPMCSDTYPCTVVLSVLIRLCLYFCSIYVLKWLNMPVVLFQVLHRTRLDVICVVFSRCTVN